MLDHNPGRARVFDAFFLAFSNDACSSPCGVISHLLPFCHVAVVGRRHPVALSQLHFQLKNCTLARHAFRVVHGFLKSGGDIQSSAKHSARIASRPCDVETNLLDVYSCLQRRPMIQCSFLLLLTHTHTHTHMYTHAHAHTRTRAHTHTHTQTHKGGV